jgi:hypothetical protein
LERKKTGVGVVFLFLNVSKWWRFVPTKKVREISKIIAHFYSIKKDIKKPFTNKCLGE